jgi:hypothetical protein
MHKWRRRVLQADVVLMALFLAVVIYGAQLFTGGFSAWFDGRLFQALQDRPWISGVVLILLVVSLLGIHFFNRGWVARRVERGLPEETATGNWRAAFRKNTVIWRSVFRKLPVGLGRGAVRQLHKLREQAEGYVQRLNNQFMDAGPGNPAGRVENANPEAPRSSAGAGSDTRA